MREIITKKEAVKRGLKFYYTGKPCINGHICSKTIHNICLNCRPNKIKFNTKIGLYDNHIAIFHMDKDYENRKLKFDFHNLTIENCYILGLLWADGGTYLKGNSIRISIQNVKEDMDQLEHIFDKTGNWAKVYAHKGIGSDGVIRKDQMKFQSSDRIFGQTLLNFGYKEKSLIPPNKILEVIPENLQSYFYRGYWDGDGCFYHTDKNRSANVVGNYNYDFSFFTDLLDKLNVRHVQIKRSDLRSNGKPSSSNRVSFNGYENIVKFGEYIYKDHLDILLPRKYEKYKKIFNQYREKLR